MGASPASARLLARGGWVLLVGLVVALTAPTLLAHTGPSTAPGAPLAAPSHLTVAAAAVSGNASWVSLTPVAGPSPLLRSAAALAYDASDGYTVLFGGCNRHVCPLADTWKYQNGLWTNLTSSLSAAPPARQGAVFVDDTQDGYLVLFGGMGASQPLNDTWRFSAGAWAPIATGLTATPPARSFAQAAYLPGSDSVVVFGGTASTGQSLGDTWTFAGGLWVNHTSTSALAPAPRAAGVLSYDPASGYAVLFGGAGTCGTYCADTWLYSTNGWTNLTSTLAAAPAARSNTTLSYDPTRGVLLLYGGWDGTAMSDTWSFSNGTWQSLTANLTVSPGARYGSASAYDSNDGYLLLFGGVLGGGHTTTWLLLSPLTATLEPAATLLVPGASVSFSAGITGGLGPFNVTWQFGDGSAPVSGATVSHTFSTAGTYSVSLTVTDSVAQTLTAEVPVTVRLSPLNVTIHPSTSTGTVGHPITFTAIASGGVAPFTYAWSAPSGVCGPDSGSVLNCTPTAAGSLQVGVTVSDSSGLNAGVGLSVTVPGTSGGGGSVPITAPATSGSSARNSNWVILLPLAVALAGALGVGIVMYRAGRRRARAQLEARPHCYAVPAWSETPPEFSGKGGDGSP
ncbi:MAG: PKD domain-containing protein [Thermoplasmata archaeon]|nr:PKD domain-containing protein [Thermoplasmata archaeon]